MYIISVKYKIYIDIDGVLANFDQEIPDHINGHTELVDYITNRAISKKPFWSALEKNKDIDKLLNFLEPYNPIILSSIGKLNYAVPQKIQWLRKNTNIKQYIFTYESKFKSTLSKENSILIDDRQYIINDWVRGGGIGILFTTAVDTIEGLKLILNS